MPVDNIPPIDDPRIILAAERTLLAWVRTGLAMMGFGFVVARFGLFLLELHPNPNQGVVHPEFGGSVYIGAALVISGVVVNLLAALSHMKTLRNFKRGILYQPPTLSLAVVVTLLVAVIGLFMTIRLLWLS